MEYIIILISAVFVNNIVLSQFLGVCPFLGVSNKVGTAAGMAGAVTFVMALATLTTYLLQYYVLIPLGIEFMQTIVFILVIAALVQMVEIILKKISPSLYQALGIYLPLISTNCAVLGVAILVVSKEFTFGSEPHMLNLLCLRLQLLLALDLLLFFLQGLENKWNFLIFLNLLKVLLLHS